MGNLSSNSEYSRFLGEHAFPASALMVRPAVAVAASVAEMLSFDKKASNMLQLCVEEAFMNAVENYSGMARPDDRVTMDFHIRGNELVISLREKGIPFKSLGEERFSAEDIKSMENPGLGVFLMESFMDKVEFLVHGRSGKEVRMTKKLASEQLPRKLLDSLDSSGRARRKRITVTNIQYRQTRLEELEDLCRMAWKCYRYTQEDFIYSKEALLHKIEHGEFDSFVAVDADSGALVMHLGLKYHQPESKVPELGMAFADTTYRIGQAAQNLGRFAMAQAQEKGCDGVFDCSVTTHSHSQRDMQEIGSSPCALMLGIAAEGMRANIPGTTEQEKGSVMNHYQAFNKEPRTIFPPEHHREIIRDIYDWMDMPRSFGENKDSIRTSEPGESFIVELPRELRAAFVVANSIGSDSANQISRHLKELDYKKMDALFAFLPLGDENSPALVKRFEEKGFFFAGIMPHIHNGDDRIILQKTNIKLDLDKIKVYGEKSRKLFDYIRRVY